MKRLITFSRYFVGILFIFSGLIKANDPLGLSYKMQEFFEIWGWDLLNDYSLILSIAIISFEIIAGVAVIIGWEFRVFSWLLFLLIVFFTFLTGYAVLSGKIRECGCFGDCIKLKADQSFAKDIILLVVSAFLLYKRNAIVVKINRRLAISTIFFVSVLSIYIQIYALGHLPVIDCLPFKKGITIQDKMKIPEGAIPDSTVIQFVYQHDGKQVEFDAEHFPDDFNDSSYTFIKRYDKLIREGNAKPEIKDFVILTPEGVDTTAAILNTESKIVMFFVKNANDKLINEFVMSELKRLNYLTVSKQIPFFVISSDADHLNEILLKQKIELKVYKGDQVAIKTAARSNPTVYLLEKGKILNKWGRQDLHQIDF